MACVNAKWEKMPPMLIVKGKTNRSLHGFNTCAALTGSIWTFQDKGWMTDEIGELWFKEVFLANCGSERPQVLILDGHSSHETLALLELAMAGTSIFSHYLHTPSMLFNPWTGVCLAPF